MAPFYYYPGFNKPNGTGECIVSLKAWNGLDSELKAVVAHACAAEAAFALAEMDKLNIAALAALTGKHGVKLAAFPNELIAAARKTATGVLSEMAAKSAIARKIHDSYMTFRGGVAAWSDISLKAVLEARTS